MFLVAQHYRPPLPDRKYWADDVARIRDAGLDGIQLWCLWGWIEAERCTVTIPAGEPAVLCW